MFTRLQRKVLTVPSSVTVDIDSRSGTVNFKSAKNELSHVFDTGLLSADVTDGVLNFHPAPVTSKALKRQVAAHLGTAIAISSNHLNGLTKPFVIELVLKGTGYKVAMKNQGSETTLVFNLGKSHEDIFALPSEVTATCPSATEVKLESANKQLLGQVAAKIRALRKVDPYKGKGVLFKGQVVSLKETKKK